MGRIIGLAFCMALLSGCGDSNAQKYAECTEKQKRQMRGALLVADDGVNRNRCKNLRTIDERELADHIERFKNSANNNSLCQMSNHKDSDWLCIHTAY